MHPAWGPYPDTVLHFPEADLIIDLRQHLPPGTPAALARAGLSGPFGVVTACNPEGRNLGEESNLRLMAVLEGVVRTHYPAALRADGHSPTGAHVEPGWAVPGTLEAIQSLAARFFQDAAFWYEGGRFFLVPVLAPGLIISLPGRAPLYDFRRPHAE